MPLKLNITREVILEHALNLIKEHGTDKLNARSLAAHIGYSTQPIFSIYKSMGELWDDIAKKAEAIYSEFVEKVLAGGEFPAKIAQNAAHVKFAYAEGALFKLLFVERADKALQKLYSSAKSKAAFAAAHGLAMICLSSKDAWNKDTVRILEGIV